MKDSTLRRTLVDGLDLWTRAVTHITTSDVLARIHDQQTTGLVTGSSDHSASRSVMWCWTHSRELHRCHRDDDCDHGTCRAESIQVTDPTGEAACTPDKASAHLDELGRLAQRLRTDGERIIRILADYQLRPATERERRNSADGDPGCWSCARLPNPHIHGQDRWEPASRRYTIGGEVRDLCTWCDRWARTHGELPARDVLERHHRGETIRVPVGGA